MSDCSNLVVWQRVEKEVAAGFLELEQHSSSLRYLMMTTTTQLMMVLLLMIRMMMRMMMLVYAPDFYWNSSPSHLWRMMNRLMIDIVVVVSLV